MTPFRNAVKAAHRTIERLNGVTITYTRGAASARFVAVQGSTPFRLDTDAATNVVVRSVDWIIRREAANLDNAAQTFASLFVEPERGDRITVENNGEQLTHLVAPVGDEPCFRPHNHGGDVYRCHTSLIARQPAP